VNTRKHSFTVRVVKYWMRLSRETEEPPSVEIFKSGLDIVLGNLTAWTI